MLSFRISHSASFQEAPFPDTYGHRIRIILSNGKSIGVSYITLSSLAGYLCRGLNLSSVNTQVVPTHTPLLKSRVTG